MDSSMQPVTRHLFFLKRDGAVIRGAVIDPELVVENDKILYEVAPESRVHSHESGRAGETLDGNA
jgi:hypothetical protein